MLKRATLLTSALLLAAPLCHADTINRVFANAEFAHGSVAFDASFDYDATLNAVVPGTMRYDVTGPLGAFTFAGIEPNIASWVSLGEAYIQIDFARLGYTGESFLRAGTYDAYWVELWCMTSRCLDRFTGDGNNFWFGSVGQVTVSPVATPEPGTFALVTMSIFALWLLAVSLLWRKRD